MEKGCRSQEENKDLVVRLNRIEGQIKTIRTQLQDKDKCDCMSILNQVRSATCAMRGVWEIIAARHIEYCVAEMEVTERNQVIEEIVSRLKELR
ncbi:MAG: metal-sensing transcriptional repressor [Alphaproteobacteria bacterium]|nr:metal-sensing transcriptional repressor [Alphaproteobacteria bacterium]